MSYNDLLIAEDTSFQDVIQELLFTESIPEVKKVLPEILMVSSYWPRECGIATYSQDLITAIRKKYGDSFKMTVCALEADNHQHHYSEDVKYVFNTGDSNKYLPMAHAINRDTAINLILIQHEFGFYSKHEEHFSEFIDTIVKPVVVVFHTVLPRPDERRRIHVQKIVSIAQSIIVMTNSSAEILIRDYNTAKEKITVIPHGTHLVPHADKETLKIKLNLAGRKVLSTFGLLGSGKNIETSLKALPAVIKNHGDVLFLIIGKTHPELFKREGEAYRTKLENMVQELQLQDHVKFINSFLPLPDLLEYLQLTDVYLFTSKDPNQAVSGTFAYAISCGCPVVSTPIPHAREVLKEDAGICFDFENASQLSEAVNSLLDNTEWRENMKANGLHRMAATAWENIAIAHTKLFEKLEGNKIKSEFVIPVVNLEHIKRLTTHFGMIQFSKINQPDLATGYTLDDNARAMIAMCQHFELTRQPESLKYISIYLDFIKYCLLPEGYFQNYVDEDGRFTDQNETTNLADSNGRAIWALGYLISLQDILPKKQVDTAMEILDVAMQNVSKIHSTRAMAFVIKGLYYRSKKQKAINDLFSIKQLADRLVQMYRHESGPDWNWYESYLTYANSILPEALLCAWLATGDPIYKDIAKTSFDFLLSKTFFDDRIRVVSNKLWLQKGADVLQVKKGGEQPIDVAYTILALDNFYHTFKEQGYLYKMNKSFNWFLGNNHLHQIIYNPCTGGCYDGLEENYVNLNQGAESTVSYLMARLTIEKYSTTEAARLKSVGLKEFSI